jgi:hypothetical protein
VLRRRRERRRALALARLLLQLDDLARDAMPPQPRVSRAELAAIR